MPGKRSAIIRYSIARISPFCPEIDFFITHHSLRGKSNDVLTHFTDEEDEIRTGAYRYSCCFFISHISHHSPRSDTRPITVQAQTNAAIAQSAGTQIGKTLFYDAAYVRLDYPNGDLPLERGVCADVVIRALRSQQVDLQKRVHEDMQAHFSAYPNNWKLKRPDSNIDHRRVPNLETWFQRQNKALPVTDKYSDYQPGDIVSSATG